MAYISASDPWLGPPRHIQRTKAQSRAADIASATRPELLHSAWSTSTPQTLTPVSTQYEKIDSEHNLQAQPEGWKPGFFKARPLLGLTALGVAIACTLASLFVLLASRGSPARNWRIQPNVYLAIATAVSNAALQCALKEAAPISWWHKALKGSSIRNLENEWQAAQSWPRAIRSSLLDRHGSRFISLLTIANIATSLVLVDGPILQHSSSVELGIFSRNITLDVPLSPELPSGFAGDRISPQNRWNVPDEALKAAQIEKPLIAGVACPDGTCTMKVQAPGLHLLNCTSKTWPITNEMMRNTAASWGENGDLLRKPFMTVSMGPGYNFAGREVVGIESGLLTVHNCSGQYVLTLCEYTAAIQEYDMILQNDTLSFTNSLALGSFVAPANNTGRISPNSNIQHNSFAPLSLVLGPSMEINATLTTYINGSVAQPYYNSVNDMPGAAYSDALNNGQCEITTTYSNDYAISKLNAAMVRGALLSASLPNTASLIDPGMSIKQNVTALQTIEENIFHSNLSLWTAAAAIQVLTIIILLPTFWGWWRIGVDLSLSPFNTARALDARLLRGCPSDAGSADFLEDLGDVKIKLGFVSPDTDEAFADSIAKRHDYRVGLGVANCVTSPQQGYASFD